MEFGVSALVSNLLVCLKENLHPVKVSLGFDTVVNIVEEKH
jgi:hypothetical protein